MRDPAEEVRMAGEALSLAEAAARFQPVLFIRRGLDYLRPECIVYEAARAARRLLIDYYVQWEDEIAPFVLWHFAYRAFRKIYYGSEKDIEFVQAGIDIDSAQVDSVAFERDPGGKMNNPFPVHELVECSRDGADGLFKVTVNGKEAQPECVCFEGGRPVLLVAMWNHIYDFYKGDGVRMDDPPLVPLNDDYYSRYKMWTRSLPPGR